MCIFSGDIKEVSETNICVIHNGTKQLTIYGMDVKLREKVESVFMILPVPMPYESSTIDCDLLCNDSKFNKEVDAIFDWCSKVFPPPVTFSFGASSSSGTGYWGTVPVKVVGSYHVSVVNNASLLDKCDPSVFTITPNVIELLRKQYPTGYGFVVAKLMKSCKYHPFAILHDAKVFGTIFVPTYHHHEHGVYSPFQSTSSSSTWGTKQTKPVRITDDLGDWDHSVYVASTNEVKDVRVMRVNERGESIAKTLPIHDSAISMTGNKCFYATGTNSFPMKRALELESLITKTVTNVFKRARFQSFIQVKANGELFNGDIMIQTIPLPEKPQSSSLSSLSIEIKQPSPLSTSPSPPPPPPSSLLSLLTSKISENVIEEAITQMRTVFLINDHLVCTYEEYRLARELVQIQAVPNNDPGQMDELRRIVLSRLRIKEVKTNDVDIVLGCAPFALLKPA